MKMTLSRLIIGVFLFGSSMIAKAQNPKILKVETKKSFTQVTIENDTFYIGGNIYVLHLEGKAFMNYTRSFLNGKNQLIFKIPNKDFTAKKNPSSMTLTYGMLSKETLKMLSDKKTSQKGKQSNNTVWNLTY